MFQMVWALIDAIVAFMTVSSGTHVGPLNGSYIGLGQSLTDNGVNTVIGDIVEANYTGYARVAMAPYTAAYRTGAPAEGKDSSLADFQPSDAVTPNQINVVFIADAASAGNLQAYYVFPNPVSLADATKHLPIIISALVQSTWSLGAVRTW